MKTHRKNGIGRTVACTAGTVLLALSMTAHAQSGLPAFFNGTTCCSGSWYQLTFPNNNLFGNFTYNLTNGLYVTHEDLGLEFVDPGSNADVYLYDYSSNSWFYTAASSFPYLFDYTSTINTWLLYWLDPRNPGHYTSNPPGAARFFLNMTTGNIVTLNSNGSANIVGDPNTPNSVTITPSGGTTFAFTFSYYDSSAMAYGIQSGKTQLVDTSNGIHCPLTWTAPNSVTLDNGTDPFCALSAPQITYPPNPSATPGPVTVAYALTLPTASGSYTVQSDVYDMFYQSTGYASLGSMPLSVTTSSLPSGQVGAPYSQALNALGGAAPYTWTLASGQLPSGLTLLSNGTLSGTPAGAGSQTFTARVTDQASNTATQTLALTVSGGTLSITTSSPLPNGQTGVFYSQTFTASGGTPGYTWSLYSGSLPSGLTLSPSGILTGTPTLSGQSTFIVRVTDQVSASATQSFGLTVLAPTQTVTTSPAGLSLTVDGAGCVSPCTYLWTAGSLHTIAATAAQTFNGTQYLFSYWSDLSPLSHQVTTAAAPTTYLATFAARVPVYGGISSSHLEVNLGDLPVDAYDGITANGTGSGAVFSCPQTTQQNPLNPWPTPPGNWIAQACMQFILSNYAIQGVTGIRFQFALTLYPSTAFDGSGNIRSAWVSNLSRFFGDLSAFGITNITPQPGWDNYGASLSQNTCIPFVPLAPGCVAPVSTQGTYCPGGTNLRFTPLLPYAIQPTTCDPTNPEDGCNYPDNTQGNNTYFCSPANPTFWGWAKHQALLGSIAGAARAANLNIEELDLSNEVPLHNFTVQARLIYDNITMTPVFELLGQALTNYGYSPTALTVSVDTDMPADLSGVTTPYPCASVYGDVAQVLGSSELLAATSGAVIGFPPFVIANGGMACDNSLNWQNPSNPFCPSPQTNPYGWAACATQGMINIPTQGAPVTQPTPTVTDMHTKPCIMSNGSCSSSDATIAARDAFSGIWDFLWYRGLTGNVMMLGETWSNSTVCNGLNDQTLTQQTIAGYLQSSLYESDPASVVFRPWGQTGQNATPCETPLPIGAPNGPFKY